jgi:hypothetical protein
MSTTMSIKETKEQIAGIDGAYWIDQRELDTSGKILFRVSPDDLKALADSHTALLEAAKDVDAVDGWATDAMQRLRAAIEQAEGE